MAPRRVTQQERKARTREAILVAAKRLFARHGVEATSLDDIAGEIGMTKGAIYANFKNKRELVYALLDRHEVPVDLSALWREGVPLADRLAEAGRHLASLLTTVPRDTVILDMEYRLDWIRNPRGRQKMKAKQGERMREVRRLIAAADASVGEKPVLEPGELLGIVSILASGIARLNVESPGAIREKTVETVFRLLAGSPEPADGG
ncbi:MAG TPA: TetR family transcriptional regulator [Gemmatimonadales bacterium]|nr:TetR family transcriptional regulator [Gemmatimonadales bacterium]